MRVRAGESKTATAELRLRNLIEAGRKWLAARNAKADRAPEPGTTLVKMWRGERHSVGVTEGAFIYPGEGMRNAGPPKLFRSLSSIAKRIVGTRIYGPRFFGLPTRCDTRKRAALDLLDALAEVGFPVRRVAVSAAEDEIIKEAAAVFRRLADDLEGKGGGSGRRGGAVEG